MKPIESSIQRDKTRENEEGCEPKRRIKSYKPANDRETCGNCEEFAYREQRDEVGLDSVDRISRSNLLLEVGYSSDRVCPLFRERLNRDGENLGEDGENDGCDDASRDALPK